MRNGENENLMIFLTLTYIPVKIGVDEGIIPSGYFLLRLI